MLQTVSVTCVPTDGGGLWWRPWIRRRSEGHRGEDRSMSCESKITHLYHLLTLHSFRVWSSLGVSREASAHHGCFISNESVMTLNYTPVCYSLSVCDVHDLLFISPWCVCLVWSLVVCRCSLEIIGRAPVSPLWSLVSLASTGHKFTSKLYSTTIRGQSSAVIWKKPTVLLCLQLLTDSSDQSEGGFVSSCRQT